MGNGLSRHWLWERKLQRAAKRSLILRWTGYQEIPDPTHRIKGQIVAMTYPQIGNYGVNPAGLWESWRPHVSRVCLIRELFRNRLQLGVRKILCPSTLEKYKIAGVQGIGHSFLDKKITC